MISQGWAQQGLVWMGDHSLYPLLIIQLYVPFEEGKPADFH
jgi:hypothetical protein